MDSSFTLEETNKERIKLGLAPLADPSQAGQHVDEEPDADTIAEQNFAERRDKMRQEKETADLKERIAKAKNKRELAAKLKGATLGDAQGEELSAAEWAKRQKKAAKLRAKQLALQEAREKEEEEMARQAYDERDLAGLKVSHAADEFKEGEDIILTLKDSRVLADDEDELQNVNLVDDAVLRAEKERKRKAQAQYTGFDDDEFDEGRIGTRPEVLAKYDEGFADTKVQDEGFRLGAALPAAKRKAEAMGNGVAGPTERVKLNLDYAKDIEVSDYKPEAAFKKPKKKKAKRSTRRGEDEQAHGEGDEMNVDSSAEASGSRINREVHDNLVDDDDLQEALAKARREAAKKAMKRKPEDIAAQIAERRAEEEAQEQVKQEPEDDRITFDDTSAFIRNVSLQSLAAPVKRERAGSEVQVKSEPDTAPVVEAGPSTTAKIVVPRVEIEEGEDVEMEEGDEDEELAEMAAREGLSLEEMRLRIDQQMEELAAGVKQEILEADGLGTTAEPVIGSGIGGYLALLKQQGAVKQRSAADVEREAQQKRNDVWLADKRARDAKLQMDRIKARSGNSADMDQAAREYANKMREQQDAKAALAAYKDYNPDVQMNYFDEFGRAMTPKEAWKSLSHRFHGKTSGRMKTEKRLRRIAEEQKELTMSSTDTPLGMSNAFSRRQEKTGEAHMVLSVGNKHSVLGAEKKGKGKGRG